nr:progressive rod-cone degeneration protein [Dromaius novaehollandiae]
MEPGEPSGGCRGEQPASRGLHAGRAQLTAGRSEETLCPSSLREGCEGLTTLRGDGGRAMCTTILLISTLVVMLRRRFFNKVEPHPEGEEETRREADSDARASDPRE